MNTARRIDDGAATQEVGAVTSIEGDAITVETGAGPRAAVRAAGCLLRPAEGDLVLLASSRRGCWVLSVLERDDVSPARVALDGDLELHADGALRVTARDGVEVATAAPVSVVAGAVGVHAAEGTVAVERVTLLGGVLSVDVAKARVVARAVEGVFERVTQRAKRAYRFVEEVEQLRAGTVDYAAKELLTVHGRGAAVTADALVKVDGAQVHIG